VAFFFFQLVPGRIFILVKIYEPAITQRNHTPAWTYFQSSRQ